MRFYDPDGNMQGYCNCNPTGGILLVLEFHYLAFGNFAKFKYRLLFDSLLALRCSKYEFLV